MRALALQWCLAACRMIPALVFIGAMAACASRPAQEPPKTRVASRPPPAPKSTPGTTPKSTTPKSPRPYKVMGKWYQPLPSAAGFNQSGVASWYGKKFHGRKTANGETYNMYGLSAAHKTLPLGTWVRVVNQDNQRTLDVRVNDRGPFVHGRIIDLSYGAAKKLGVIGPGTARVRVSALGKLADSGTKTPSGRAPTYEPVDWNRGKFTFQVGAFKDRGNAHRLSKTLARNYQNVHITSYYHETHGTLYGVRLGLATTLQQAGQYKQILRQNGFDGAFTIAE